MRAEAIPQQVGLAQPHRLGLPLIHSERVHQLEYCRNIRGSGGTNAHGKRNLVESVPEEARFRLAFLRRIGAHGEVWFRRCRSNAAKFVEDDGSKIAKQSRPENLGSIGASIDDIDEWISGDDQAEQGGGEAHHG